MLNAAVIGLGVGQHHVRAFNSHPGCRVAVACDLRQERLDAVLAEFPDTATTTDAAAVIADPDIDIVSVAGFDDVHAEQAVAALRAGKHVFVEKPICQTRKELDTLVEALSARPDLRLSSNLPLRTAPRFARVRQAVQEGRFGRVYHLEGDYYWGRTEKLTRGWRTDMEFYSIIHGACIHLVDLAVWLTGEWPVSVYATGNGLATSGSALRFNDFGMLVLTFPSGMTAKITGHGGCVHPHFHRVAVFGSAMTFLNEGAEATWIESSDPGAAPAKETDGYPARENRGESMTTFIDSIVNPGIRPLVTMPEAIHVMDICLAAEDAVCRGQARTITYTKI